MANSSIAVATTASTATRPTVPGNCRFSSAASVSAVKAAMSPNGTKTMRVTEKIRTKPSSIKTSMAPVATPSMVNIAAICAFIAGIAVCHTRPDGASGLVFPRAVDELHDDQAALVDPVVGLRREIVDGVQG